MAIKVILKVLGLSGFVLCCSTSALADAKDDYKAAIGALEAHQTEKAAKLLQRAIDERPQSSANLFRTYLPNYYLGLALADLGDCRGALDSWNNSERQGAIKKADEEYANLRERRQICKSHLRDIEQVARQAKAHVEKATDLSHRITRLEADPVLRPVWSKEFKPRQYDALKFLWDARSKLREGKEDEDLSKLQLAATLASQAVDGLKSLAVDAENYRANLVVETRYLDRLVGEVVQQAQAALRACPNQARSAPRVARLRSRLQSLLDETKTLENLESDRVETLRGEIEVLSASLRQAAQAPPEQLQLAATAFMQRDYRGTLATLQALEAKSGRESAQACVLRSASLHALGRLGQLGQLGQLEDGVLSEMPGEAESLDPAMTILLECEALSASFEPSLRIFSPPFLELFAQLRQYQEEASPIEENPP